MPATGNGGTPPARDPSPGKPPPGTPPPAPPAATGCVTRAEGSSPADCKDLATRLQELQASCAKSGLRLGDVYEAPGTCKDPEQVGDVKFECCVTK